MWKYIWIVCAILLALLVLMGVLYIVLIKKVRNTNTKIYKYKEEVLEKEENVLIIYQPSKHKTIQSIVSYIKEELEKTDYGYVIHTLDTNLENYDKYKKVIFVAPVYFGAIHNEFLRKVLNYKFKNLVIIYNGLNGDSNKEDEFIKKNVNKYKKIKVHTEDIELVKEFMEKEIKTWKKL